MNSCSWYPDFTRRLGEEEWLGELGVDNQWYNDLYRMTLAVEADGLYYPGGIVIGWDERRYIFGNVERPLQQRKQSKGFNVIYQRVYHNSDIVTPRCSNSESAIGCRG